MTADAPLGSEESTCPNCGGNGCMWCSKAPAAERLQEWEEAETAIAVAAAAAVPAPPTRVGVTLTPEQWQAVHGLVERSIPELERLAGEDATAVLRSTLVALYDGACGITT